ncbi:hypothetical protein Tco_0582756 [Tanacetum coccineum]
MSSPFHESCPHGFETSLLDSTLVVSQTSTLITGASSLIPSSGRCSTILDYVANLLVISALYNARFIMVKFALVAQRTSPRVPLNFDNWDTALLQSFDFSIHDFCGFLDKMKLVINMESIQRTANGSSV